jgi:hypothetical protein
MMAHLHLLSLLTYGCHVPSIHALSRLSYNDTRSIVSASCSGAAAWNPVECARTAMNGYVRLPTNDLPKAD